MLPWAVPTRAFNQNIPSVQELLDLLGHPIDLLGQLHGVIGLRLEEFFLDLKANRPAFGSDEVGALAANLASCGYANDSCAMPRGFVLTSAGTLA